MTPGQAGFPGAQLAARLETRGQHPAKGKAKAYWPCAIVCLLSSHTLEDPQAAGLLRLATRSGPLTEFPVNPKLAPCPSRIPPRH